MRAARGLTAVAKMWLPNAAPFRCALATATLRRFARSVRRREPDRREVVLRGQRVVGVCQMLVDGVSKSP